MAATNRKYLALESGVPKVRDSQGDEVIFTLVRIGGASGKDISLVSGNFDFNAVKLVNIVAGTATGHAVEYDQLNTALGLKQSTSEKGNANGYASLDGGGKVPAAQLPSAVMTYEGVWNATTNSPELEDGTGDAGMVYRVGTAGTQDLGSGNISFSVGDYVIYSGTVWEKSDTTDAVASINGLTGVVELDTDDIDEGSTNLYFTEARAKTATVGDAIANGVTDVAPSQNAVFDALALKANIADVASLAETLTNDEGATINAREVVFLTAAGLVQLAQANDTLKPWTIIRMVKDGTIADEAAGSFYKPGSVVGGFTGLTALGPVYLSRSAAGGYQQDLSGFVTGEHVVLIGTAISTTQVEFNPRYVAEM